MNPHDINPQYKYRVWCIRNLMLIRLIWLFQVQRVEEFSGGVRFAELGARFSAPHPRARRVWPEFIPSNQTTEGTCSVYFILLPPPPFNSTCDKTFWILGDNIWCIFRAQEKKHVPALVREPVGFENFILAVTVVVSILFIESHSSEMWFACVCSGVIT